MKKLNALNTTISLFLTMIACLSFNYMQAQDADPIVQTVQDTVCSDDLSSYSFLNRTFTEAGTYTIPVLAADSTDSLNVILELFVWENRHDTIYVADCGNKFPIQYGTVTFHEPGKASLSYSKDTNNCAIVNHFIVEAYPIYDDTVNVSICKTELPFFFGEDTLYHDGTYTHAEATTDGCDSLYTLVLNVLSAYQFVDTLTDTVCSFFLPYTYGDSLFYQSGVYDFELHTADGCDSVDVHLDLTVLESHVDTVEHYLCASEFPYTLDSAHVYPEPGVYYFEMADTLNCHDVTLVILHSYPVYDDTIRVSVCEYDVPYSFADSLFYESTSYTFVDTSAKGCDSLTTLVLTVNTVYAKVDTLELASCRSDLPYLYGDSLLSEEGYYNFLVPTTAGCDSLERTVIFSIMENPADTIELVVCHNDFPYQYGDTLLDSAGTFALRIADSLGCDTLRLLTLQEAEVYHDSLSVVVCANNPYSIADSVLTEPGVYDIMLQSQYGCDSLITITLEHHPVYHQDTLDFTRCDNQLPLEYGDSLFYTEGLHEVYFQTDEGCDSVITIRLTINPVLYNSDTLYQTICRNELPYTAFGRELTEAGTYPYITSSLVTGCDSVFYFHLIVNDNPVVTIEGDDYLCSGSTTLLNVTPAMVEYQWNNGFSNQLMEISAAGEYTVTVTDANGCQSTAAKTVTAAALPNIHITGDAAICYGDSAVLNVSGGSQYRWEDGSIAEQIVVYPTATTLYKVTGTDDTPCSNVSQFTVTVRTLPVPIVSGNAVICQGDATVFSASNASAYEWSTGQTAGSITVQEAGTYTVTVTDVYGCRGSASRELTVHATPDARISGASHFCSGESSTLKAEPSSSAYLWSFNDMSDQTITITTGGEYRVTITNEHGCVGVASKTVVIDTLPRIVITGNQVICQGESAVLTVTGANTYSWDNGSTDNQIVVYPTENTTYRVVGTNSALCVNQNSFMVSVRDLPTPSIATSKTSICRGDSAVLTASAGNLISGVSYSWSTGAESNRITIYDDNTYTVTVTDAFGCMGSTQRSITLNENPAALISGVQHFCEGGSTSLKAMPDGCSYSWGVFGMTDQTITVTTPGIYEVTVTNAAGCRGTASREVIADTLPHIVIAGNSAICKGDSAVLTVTGANSYRWEDGSSASRIVVHPTTQTTYRVTGTNLTPCSNTNSFTISVRALPTPTISGNNNICQLDSTVFEADGGQSYVWSNGRSGDRITVRTAGTYRVTATDAFGCQGSATRELIVNDRPNAQISGNTRFCSGQSSLLRAMPNGCTYEWDYQDLNEQTVTVSAGGTYTVTVTNTAGCSNTATRTVVVDTLPELQITGNTSICKGDSAVLVVTGANTYQWDNGSAASRIVVYPTTATTYRVTGTNLTPCSNENAFTVYVRELPTPVISGENAICQGDTALFVATGGTQYAWSNGSVGDRVTVRNAGNYTVTATDAYGCKGTASRSLTINARPAASIVGTAHFCEGNSSTLKAMPDGCHYVWSENGLADQQLTVTSEGDYSVTVTNAAGCTGTASRTVTVDSLPDIHIQAPAYICKGDTAVLTVSGANSYRWDNNSSASRLVVSPTATTTYQVTGTNLTPCSNSNSFTITVRDLPVPAIAGVGSICRNDSAVFTATGAVSYIWSDGGVGNRITVREAGTYTVTAYDSYGCAGNTSRELVVNDNPTALISGSTHFCDGQSTALRALPEGCTYVWSHDGSTQQTTTVSSAGTYTVTVTNTNGCKGVASKEVLTDTLPTLLVQGNSIICAGDSAVLTVTGANTYRWDNGSTASRIVVHPTTTTIYRVTGTNNTPCTNETSFTVTVRSLPTPTISGTNEICQNESTSFVATGGVSYTWSTGAQTDRITVQDADIYTVTATDAFGCSNTTTRALTVNPLPDVRINGSTLFCQGRTTTLTAVGASTYEWQETGDIQQTITVSQPGTYTVIGTNANGCRATASKTISTTQVSNVSLSGSTSFCHGQSTTLTVIGDSQGVYEYEWDNGLSTRSIVITTPGAYSVTISDAHNCQKVLSTTITENALPTPSISGTLEICDGSTTRLTASGGQSYMWDGNQNTSSITVNSSGTYTVTATNINGCSASASVDVVVYPQPSIQIMTSRDHVCSSTESITLRAIVPNGNSYFWSEGQETQSITVVPGSTRSYNVYVIDIHGCSNTSAVTIMVSPEITPYISGNAAICQGASTTLQAYSNAISPVYQWSTHQTNSSIEVNTAGNYTVTVTDNSGCTGTASMDVVVNSLPVATISDGVTICQGDTATLTVQADAGCSVLWRTENGQTVIGNQPTLKTTVAGGYIAIITNSKGCSIVRSTEVMVNPRPQVSITGNTAICQGNTTWLTAVGDSTCSYHWATSSNNRVEVSSAGVYTVTATNSYNCSGTASVEVMVRALPEPVISGTATICPGASTTLTATEAAGYRWSTGDSTGMVVVTPSATQVYTLTVTDEYGCTGSTSYQVSISDLPQVSILGDTSFCVGASTQLTATPGYSYQWSNGETAQSITVTTGGTYFVTAYNAIGCENTASVQTVMRALPELNFGMQHDICEGDSYTYTLPSDSTLTYRWSNQSTGNTLTVSTAGVYTVTVTNQYGCERSASDQLIVHELPSPVISGETSLCRGTSTLLTVLGGTRYQWSNGSTTNFITVTPTNETTYAVTAYNNYNCSATAYHTVTVKVLPSIYFSGNTTFCEGSSTNITASGGSSCVWSTGSSNPTITVSTPGTYTVTVTNLQGCQRSDTVSVTTRPNPIVSISGLGLICAGTYVQLSANGALTYEWNTGATGSSITALPATTTDYSVTGYDQYGCYSTVHKTVSVEALPDVQISGVNALCFGDTATFTATGGGSYMWSNGSQTAVTRASAAGNYTVTVTSPNGCTAIGTVALTLYPTPVPTISGPTSLCENNTATLTAQGGDFYFWNTGATTPSLEISQGGNYSVVVSNGYNCSATAVHTVADLAQPSLYLSGNSSICEGTSATLSAYGNAAQYLWSTGDAGSSVTVSPTVTTLYHVTATGNNGCVKEDSLQIAVNPVYAIQVAGTICEGTGYNQYGFSIPVQNEPGTFTFDRNLQTIHGCDSIITLTLTVNPLPVMPDSITGNPRITRYGSYVYSVSDAQYANTFEWRISNLTWTLSNSNTSTVSLDIPGNGSGILTAKGINECGFREVSMEIYCNVGVDEYINATNILVYPVPTRQTLNINLENAVTTVSQIQLYDNLGRLLQTVPVHENLIQLDCGSYAAGVYYVRFLDHEGNKVDTRKITVRR